MKNRREDQPHYRTILMATFATLAVAMSMFVPSAHAAKSCGTVVASSEVKRGKVHLVIEGAVGFNYLDKRVERDERIYRELSADYVVFAVHGRLHESLRDSWLGREHPPKRVFFEKPMASTLEEARSIVASASPFDPRQGALDHYRPKLSRTRALATKDLKWLGGLATLEFVLTENRSGSDPQAALKTDNGRDGAIEREGRVAALQEGVAADLVPHGLADFDYYGSVESLRPIRSWAGKYKGVDGDPNRVTEIPRETFFASEFEMRDHFGNLVQSRVIVGKGLRTRAYGPEYEHETKLMILTGRHGRKLIFDLRGRGNGAGTLKFIGTQGQVVKTEALEQKPYRVFLEGVVTGQSLKTGHSVFAEDALAYREKLRAMTNGIGDGRALPIYEGGMSGVNARPAPYAEDLLETLPAMDLSPSNATPITRPLVAPLPDAA